MVQDNVTILIGIAAGIAVAMVGNLYYDAVGDAIRLSNFASIATVRSQGTVKFDILVRGRCF